MLDWLFIILLVIAFLLMLFSIEKYRDGDTLWAFVFGLLSTVLWFLLAASVLEIEQPYQMYNASSEEIETGIHIVTSKVAPEMVYLFQIPGIIMMLFTFLQVFSAIYDYLFKKKKRM